MKLNAVGVTSKDLKKSVGFYKLLGFTFNDFKDGDDHVESIPKDGSAKLMIDSHKLITDLIGKEPTQSNHFACAIEHDSPAEVNTTVEKIRKAGFTIVTEPWDAFWGQRYAVVEDPEGYKVDLYSPL